MKFIADLHVHSYLSRATSKNANVENIYRWAQLKGLTVVGTGDFTHPAWFAELEEKLEPAENGLFALKKALADPIQQDIPASCRNPVRFMLTVEISNIYKKKEKTRKVHNLVCVPDFQSAAALRQALEKIGNLKSDGRPILGLDSRDLLEMVLQTSDRSYLIPSHIWTPWFSALGSKSGFDSIDECYDDLSAHIFAVETGLSSDPPMNWRISGLDRFALISNSDAHSPEKLGREANIFDAEPGYDEIMGALKKDAPAGRFLGTLEFFPAEGKYHFDGHRKCRRRMETGETLERKGKCPVCGKPVTLGVLYRVCQLADREEGKPPPGADPYKSLISLRAVLAEVHEQGPDTKKVSRDYFKLLDTLGPELTLLQDAPLEQLEENGSPLLREGIRRMREGRVRIEAGYDGEYGSIRLFTPGDRKKYSPQQSLFTLKAGQGEEIEKQKRKKVPPPPRQKDDRKNTGGEKKKPSSILEDLNPEQKEAVEKKNAPLMIIAGPGTGKTRTLTARIAQLLADKGAPPDRILAVTFTNKAAQEMKERLETLIPETGKNRDIPVLTFHALCHRILSETGFPPGSGRAPDIIHEKDALEFFGLACRSAGLPVPVDRKKRDILSSIHTSVQRLIDPEEGKKAAKTIPQEAFLRAFLETQKSMHLLDYDSLLFHTVTLLEKNPALLKTYMKQFRYIFVDEYQDINPAQHALVRRLAGDGKRLTVIGDPDQAIYGFRGASSNFFLSFQDDFPGAEVVTLSRNYRSTKTILNAAGQLMAGKNKSRKVWSDIEGSPHIEICPLQSEKAEAEFIVHTIESMLGGTRFFSLDSGRVRDGDGEEKDFSFGDFAVLYRVHQLGEKIEEAFLRSGIPYQRRQGRRFCEKPPVASLLYFFQILENPLNSFALYQLLRSPLASLPASRAEALRYRSFTERLSPADVLQWGKDHLILTAGRRESLERIQQAFLALQRDAVDMPLGNLIDLLLKAFDFTSFYPGRAREADEDIEVLKGAAEIVGKGINPFLAYLALQGEADSYDFKAEKVSLMTLHAAKGLEFPVVFIAACEEGLLPLAGWFGKSGDPEEERRLFYVGVTRAAERLYMTYSNTRSARGERKTVKPSPYLTDIEQDLTRLFDTRYGKKSTGRKDDTDQMTLF